MAVSKRLRFEILRRDNHTCRYCGGAAPDVKITVDHVVPKALGGTDDPSNLVAACEPCNTGKSSVPADVPLVADVAADALRWATAMRRAVELEREKRTSDAKFVADFLDRASELIRADPHETKYCLPDLESSAVGGLPGIRRTIIQFRDNGLDLGDLERALLVAATNRLVNDQESWKYFCGICWRTIEDRQLVARDLLTSGQI